VVNPVDLDVDGLDDVMADQLKVLMSYPVGHVCPFAREKVVQGDHVVAHEHQAVDQVRAHKAGPARDEDAQLLVLWQERYLVQRKKKQSKPLPRRGEGEDTYRGVAQGHAHVLGEDIAVWHVGHVQLLQLGERDVVVERAGHGDHAPTVAQLAGNDAGRRKHPGRVRQDEDGQYLNRRRPT